jgi:hypothetical protein
MDERFDRRSSAALAEFNIMVVCPKTLNEIISPRHVYYFSLTDLQ